MFSSCIVKLTAVCNLDCTYCYMFQGADRTFERVPAMMPLDTALALVDRVERHLDQIGRRPFHLTLHGGEPTLWPEPRFAALLQRIRRSREAGYDIGVAVQTNGLRPLPSGLLDELRATDVRLGISVDGPRRQHDRFRVDHRGRGSYERIMANVAALAADGFSDLIGGFLCVADPTIPVDELLAWADSLPVRRLDVLWPIQFNHDHPPWQRGEREAYQRHPRYGEWYARLFAAWWRRDDPSLHIRLFFDALQYRLGARAHLDVLVNDRLDMLTVNTDGGYEYPDYLRGAVDGGCRTDKNVREHDLSTLASDPVFRQLLQLGEHLPEACRSCPHVDICGGGFLPGRTSARELLTKRRSVLCADQKVFFDAIESCLSHPVT